MTRLERSLISCYLNSGVREVIPIYPLYALLFQEHGISTLGLSTLFVIWSLTAIVTEVPSGALADRWSRRSLIIASGLLKSIAFISWWAWPTMAGFALGFILWGGGSALRSGAFEALLYDLLAHHGLANRYGRSYAIARGLAMTGVAVGELLGGVLIVLGFDFVLLVSAAIPLVATIPFALYVEDPPKEQSTTQRRYLDHLRDGAHEVAANPRVTYIALATALVMMVPGVYDEFIPPVLYEKGFLLVHMGYIGALVYLAQAGAMFLAGRGRPFGSAAIWITMAGAGFLLAATGTMSKVGSLAAITLFMFLCALVNTQFQASLQHAIERSARATVTSAVGLCHELGGIAGFILFGLAAEFAGMQGGTVATGLYTATLAILFLVYRRALKG